VHVARSDRGGAWAAWHWLQSACAATVWSAGSEAEAWHVAHFGGDATPFGPCASWQVAHPPVTVACTLAASLLWQDAHVAAGERSPL
jgi:hypothetical protein